MSLRFRSVGSAPARCLFALLVLALAGPARAQEVAPDSAPEGPGAGAEAAAIEARPDLTLAVLPFRVNASRGTQFPRPFGEMLGERLAGFLERSG